MLFYLSFLVRTQNIPIHMNRSKKDPGQRRLGLERIERLFELAGKEFERHPERAHRNVQLARKIAMRYNIRMPSRLKRRFCRKCYKYLSPNINCKTSRRRGLLVVRCMECGNIMKAPDRKKRKPGLNKQYKPRSLKAETRLE